MNSDIQTMRARLIFNSVAAFGMRLADLTRDDDQKFALWLRMPENVTEKSNPDYFEEARRKIGVLYMTGNPTFPKILLDVGPMPNMEFQYDERTPEIDAFDKDPVWEDVLDFSPQSWTAIVRSWAALVANKPEILQLKI